MSRITLSDTVMTAVLKIVDGNPGAMIALTKIMDAQEEVDPQDIMGKVGVPLSFDTHEIYGTDIYVLWNDKCRQDARKVIMLMRAVQLGFLPEERLKEIAADQTRSVNLTDEEMEELDRKVCDELEEFKRPEEVTA